MSPEQRARALVYLSRFVGTEVTAAFLQKTDRECPLAGIPHIHSLQEGIYKPAGSEHVFCVWSRSAAGGVEARYPDELRMESDGTWAMDYAPKDGGLDLAVNRGLLACFRDKLPVLAIATTRPKGAAGGARYRILGLAMVEDYDRTANLFRLRGCTAAVADSLRGVAAPDEVEEVDIRDRLVLPFVLSEPRPSYASERDLRDRAFRSIVLDEYKRQCCVCGALFLLKQDGKEPLVEAEAAHIIPVPKRGPDDPRNGLSLCRRHHWAFDRGLFTVTEARLVRISPAVRRAQVQRFDLEEYEGEPIAGPARESCVPDPSALAWHQDHVFRVA